ncbi:MAG: SDR family oxidoreductase [Acidobacteria bacterium]|nr:SDR family oxidoreductase [Acidobacteriota bacterium]
MTIALPGPVRPGGYPAPVAVVTGANSGIGRATAVHLAELGFTVVATVRSADKAGKLLALAAARGTSVAIEELDVADDRSVSAGFGRIIGTFGGVDVLVNNAGIGGNGAVEESSPAQFHESFNVNAVGAVRCAAAVLPGMRGRGRGAIVNVSSVVGRIGAVAQAPYVASKWAVEGISEQLAHEVAPFGVRVAVVEPGITRSSIFAKNVDAPNATGAYAVHYRRMFAFYAAGLEGATPAEDVAGVIARAITTDEPRLRWVCSWGGPGIVDGRTAMTDEEWVALGLHDDDAGYADEFAARFGVDLSAHLPPSDH